MGVYSTIEVSRKWVIEQIEEKINSATDEKLCDALFALTCDDTLDNYMIKNDFPY